MKAKGEPPGREPAISPVHRQGTRLNSTKGAGGPRSQQNQRTVRFQALVAGTLSRLVVFLLLIALVTCGFNENAASSNLWE